MQETDRLTLKNGITYLLQDAKARAQLAELLTEVMEKYGADNPPPYPVTSVNGQTGAVTVTVPTATSDLTNDSGFVDAAGAAAAAPVQSVNGQTGAVTIPVRTEVISVETAFAIPASGASVSYDLEGITSDHELVRWNFSSSAENQPPVDLQWDTYDGYFTITNTSGTTSESIRPVFVLPTKSAATTH